MQRTETNAVRLATWVIDGGWQVLAGCAAVLAVIVCICVFMAVRLLNRPEDAFTMRMPVVTGMGVPKLHWRYARMGHFMANGRRIRSGHNTSIKAEKKAAAAAT